MIRILALCLLAAACGRSEGVRDEDLGDLVIAPKLNEQPIDVARAAKDPDELARALAVPAHEVAARLGPHVVSISTSTQVVDGTQTVESLDDHATIELGDAGSFHAVYTNSADYGREVMFVGGKLYLRPRYQRWHVRDPEERDEPVQVHDAFYEALFATWDLVAPAAQVRDGGDTLVAGRAARKIELELAAVPRPVPAEQLAQRHWRQTRSIEAVTGEIALDAEKGVPLAVKLAGTIGFARDGHRYTMKVSVESSVSGVGQAVAIAAPPAEEVVATPERLREVDDRDLLLKGIAPPLRKPDAAGSGKEAKP